MKASGIYCIRNTITGSEYIGSAVIISDRWKTHRHTLRQRGKAPPKLQQAWDKYGEAAFEFLVLEECQRDDLLTREQHWIDARSPKYNTRAQAHSNIGVKWSPEINARKGRPRTVYTVAGVTGSLEALCKHFGNTTPQSAHYRLKHGWTPEATFTTPAASKRDVGTHSAKVRKAAGFKPKGADLEFRGVRGSLAELTRLFSEHSYFVVRSRRRRGMTLEDALLAPRMRK